MKYQLFTALALALPLAFYAQKLPKAVDLKPEQKISLSISEPSDIAKDPNGKGYYIVSDGGKLFKTDENGSVLESADFDGADLEGVYAKGKYVYIVNESAREISVLDANNMKKLVRRFTIPYNGPRNQGFESIAMSEAGDTLYLITEKSPVLLYRVCMDKNGMNQAYDYVPLKQFKEISSCTYYQGKWWLLSDEERTVYQCDKDFNIEKSYRIPVLNPEGICFSQEGKMLIVSDDLHKIFVFKP
jgi:uncharacterized protein YjiK